MKTIIRIATLYLLLNTCLKANFMLEVMSMEARHYATLLRDGEVISNLKVSGLWKPKPMWDITDDGGFSMSTVNGDISVTGKILNIDNTSIEIEFSIEGAQNLGKEKVGIIFDRPFPESFQFKEITKKQAFTLSSQTKEVKVEVNPEYISHFNGKSTDITLFRKGKSNPVIVKFTLPPGSSIEK